MAYKISYKVVSEQGEQLKKTAKDMDNYVSQLSQIISRLGNDKLLSSVRSDLKKFQQQLETESTVLDMAGQILSEVVQSYSGAEKKSVAKVDKIKAHNRDFYKRPVVVASAGGGAAYAGGGSAAAVAYAGGAAASDGSAVAINQTVVNNTYIINEAAPENANILSGFGGAAGAFSESALKSAGETAGAAAAIGMGVAAGGMAASAINEKRKEGKENSVKESKAKRR